MIFHCFPIMADLIAMLWLMLLPLIDDVNFLADVMPMTMGYNN